MLSGPSQNKIKTKINEQIAKQAANNDRIQLPPPPPLHGYSQGNLLGEALQERYYFRLLKASFLCSPIKKKVLRFQSVWNCLKLTIDWREVALGVLTHLSRNVLSVTYVVTHNHAIFGAICLVARKLEIVSSTDAIKVWRTMIVKTMCRQFYLLG